MSLLEPNEVGASANAGSLRAAVREWMITGAALTIPFIITVMVLAFVLNFVANALTPVVGALNSGDIKAAAVASLQSAICNAPPLMICNPKASPTATDKLTASVPVGDSSMVCSVSLPPELPPAKTRITPSSSRSCASSW